MTKDGHKPDSDVSYLALRVEGLETRLDGRQRRVDVVHLAPAILLV